MQKKILHNKKNTITNNSTLNTYYNSLNYKQEYDPVISRAEKIRAADLNYRQKKCDDTKNFIISNNPNWIYTNINFLQELSSEYNCNIKEHKFNINAENNECLYERNPKYISAIKQQLNELLKTLPIFTVNKAAYNHDYNAYGPNPITQKGKYVLLNGGHFFKKFYINTYGKGQLTLGYIKYNNWQYEYKFDKWEAFTSSTNQDILTGKQKVLSICKIDTLCEGKNTNIVFCTVLAIGAL